MSRLWILTGDDYSLELFTRQLQHTAAADEVVSLDGRELKAADLVPRLLSLPMFSGRRLVLIRRLVGSTAKGRRTETEDGPAGGGRGRTRARELAGVLLQADPRVVVIALEPGLEREPSPENNWLLAELKGLAPDLRLSRQVVDDPDATLGLVETVLEAGPKPATEVVITRFAPSGPDATLRWARRRAREAGVEFESGALEALAERVGYDRRLIDLELEKLRLYAGPERVTRDDIRRLVVETVPVSAFDLLGLVVDGDGAGAVKLIRQLRREGENPQNIVGALAWSLRAVRLLQTQPPHPDLNEVHQATGLFPGQIRQLLPLARRLGTRRTEQALSDLLDLDRQVKTGQVDAWLGLELWLTAQTAAAMGS
jgi:DNA polymerase III delta subunit